MCKAPLTTVLDDCTTENIVPNKTHWAVPLDQPPFYAYALKPGITFTYLGLKVEDDAAVRLTISQAATCLSQVK